MPYKPIHVTWYDRYAVTGISGILPYRCQHTCDQRCCTKSVLYGSVSSAQDTDYQWKYSEAAPSAVQASLPLGNDEAYNLLMLADCCLYSSWYAASFALCTASV